MATALTADLLRIIGRAEQGIEFSRLAQLDFEKPAFAKHEERKGSGRRQIRTPVSPDDPPLPQDASSKEESWDTWAKDHPTNFWAMMLRAQEWMVCSCWICRLKKATITKR